MTWDRIPDPPKLSWWRKIILWLKTWWHWNIVLRRRITFPEIRNPSCGIPIDELIAENQYPYTKENNWWRWVDKNESNTKR